MRSTCGGRAGRQASARPERSQPQPGQLTSPRGVGKANPQIRLAFRSGWRRRWKASETPANGRAQLGRSAFDAACGRLAWGGEGLSVARPRSHSAAFFVRVAWQRRPSNSLWPAHAAPETPLILPAAGRAAVPDAGTQPSRGRPDAAAGLGSDAGPAARARQRGCRATAAAQRSACCDCLGVGVAVARRQPNSSGNGYGMRSRQAAGRSGRPARGLLQRGMAPGGLARSNARGAPATAGVRRLHPRHGERGSSAPGCPRGAAPVRRRARGVGRQTAIALGRGAGSVRGHACVAARKAERQASSRICAAPSLLSRARASPENPPARAAVAELRANSRASLRLGA